MKRQRFAYWILAIVCSLFFLSATDDDSVHLPEYYVDAAKQCFARQQNEEAKLILDKGVKNDFFLLAFALQGDFPFDGFQYLRLNAYAEEQAHNR